ncbi:MAG: hypothetical protein NTW11_02400 [Candidatus Staskawiczbacteria bacterium]|nr:hypothetical protein [Candidatus Staskawiczbacteria bacterium]
MLRKKNKNRKKKENKNLVIYLVIFGVALLLIICSIFSVLNLQQKLNPAQIMEIIKTDKDYSGLSTFVSGFDPEIITYKKLGPNEYKNLKQAWQSQGLADRVKLVDALTLTNSTYWIELRNKNDQTKGLRTIIDVKTKTSLLLMAALSINVGVGM